MSYIDKKSQTEFSGCDFLRLHAFLKCEHNPYSILVITWRFRICIKIKNILQQFLCEIAFANWEIAILGSVAKQLADFCIRLS